jgi:hypothetical protein
MGGKWRPQQLRLLSCNPVPHYSARDDFDPLSSHLEIRSRQASAADKLTLMGFAGGDRAS